MLLHAAPGAQAYKPQVMLRNHVTANVSTTGLGATAPRSQLSAHHCKLMTQCSPLSLSALVVGRSSGQHPSATPQALSCTATVM